MTRERSISIKRLEIICLPRRKLTKQNSRSAIFYYTRQASLPMLFFINMSGIRSLVNLILQLFHPKNLVSIFGSLKIYISGMIGWTQLFNWFWIANLVLQINMSTVISILFSSEK